MTWAPAAMVMGPVASWGISHNVIVRRWFGEAHCRMVERRQLMDCGVPPLPNLPCRSRSYSAWHISPVNGRGPRPSRAEPLWIPACAGMTCARAGMTAGLGIPCEGRFAECPFVLRTFPPSTGATLPSRAVVRHHSQLPIVTSMLRKRRHVICQICADALLAAKDVTARRTCGSPYL